MKFVARLLLVSGVYTLVARSLTVSTQWLFVDTTHTSARNYQTFICLAEAAGISIIYEHPSMLMNRDLCGCDGVILALDEQFLMHQESTYAQLVIEPLKKFMSSEKKFLWLLLPDRAFECNGADLVRSLCSHLNISSPLIKPAAAQFIDHYVHARPLYTTTCGSGARVRVSIKRHLDGVEYLPRMGVARLLANNVPVAVLIKTDTARVILSARAQMSFCDLTEQGMRNPLDIGQRRQLLRINAATCADVCAALMHERQLRPLRMHYDVLNDLVSERVRYRTNSAIYKDQKGVYQWTSNGICCGWMGIDDDHDLVSRNCAFIAQTDFDMLWLELPMSLYGDQKKFDERVKYFTQRLVHAYKKINKEFPKIFLDFDVAATLSWCKLATHPVDVYGASYEKIPAPLDYEQFWRPSILTVMKSIFDRWRANIGSCLPIDGVLFNLYFWNNKDAMPYYTNLIDFSDSAWHHFCSNEEEDAQHTPAARVTYILEHNKFDAYLFTLEYAAYQLALTIKEDIKKVAACAMIAVYTAAPFDTWFYKGLLRGFSDMRNPVLWFTNNINYYGHADWWQAQTINAFHVTNVLLSHFNHTRDIARINKIAQMHDGLWYSRVSRIGQKYEPDRWWSAEATTMKPERLIKLISRQARKK